MPELMQILKGKQSILGLNLLNNFQFYKSLAVDKGHG